MISNSCNNTQNSFIYPSNDTEIDQRIEIAKKFQVGDLVFTKMNKGFNKIDSFTVLMQKVVNWIYSKNIDPSYSNYTHVAIVVDVNQFNGQVLIAEAMPTKNHKKDLRIVDLLSDNSCQLQKNKNYSYEIVRITDKNLIPFIPKTVEIAKKLAERASYLLTEANEPQKESPSKKSLFSFWNAIKAIFSKQPTDIDPLNPGTTKRIFKQIYDTTSEINTATGGSKPRKFFCASFVGYLLQTSEATHAWETLKKNHPNMQVELTQVTGSNIKKPVSKWAKRMTKEHGTELNNLMQHYRFDAKKTGPGALRSFFKQKNIETFSLEGC